MAPSQDEPRPPAGVSREGVEKALLAALDPVQTAAFMKWLTVTWPGWGREGWGRLDQAREGCAGH